MTRPRWRALALASLALGCDLDLLAPPDRTPSPPPLPSAGGSDKPPSALPAGSSVHLTLGAPVDASPQDEIVLVKPQYVVSYDRFRNDPNWVAWRLAASDLGDVGRTQRIFSPDPQLPEGVYQVHHRDYAGSGYDHGHLCPSGERTATVEDNAATFLTTNIVPQRHAINAGAWETLERWCVEKARAGWDLFIVAGPVFDPACATDRSAAGNLPSEACPAVGRSPDPARRVAIPVSTWKVVVVVPHGRGLDAVTASTPVIAVDMPNEAGGGTTWERYVTTVDALEARTGYDLLGLVPREVQARIESRPYAGEQ